MAKQTLIPATAEVRLPRLQGVAPFFGADDEPVWHLRQLDHLEYFKLREVVTGQQAKLIRAAADALAGGNADRRADLLREILGSTDAVPPELAYRIEAVILGTTSPKVERDDVLKLWKHWPADAWILSDKVLELTGQGASLGKPTPSGPNPKSKRASTSARSEGDSSTKSDPTSSLKAD